MSAWLDISLFAAICPLFLAAYAIERDPRSPRNLYFAGMCVSASALALGSYLAHGASSAEQAVVAARATRWCFLFTPAFFLAFCLHFCHVAEGWRRPLILGAFAATAVFSVVSSLGLMVGDFVFVDGRFKPLYEPVYYVYLAVALVIYLIGACVLLVTYRRAGRYQRNRMLLLMVALVLSVALGLLAVLLMHHVRAPLAPWAVFLPSPVIALSFLRHRLLSVGNYVRISVTLFLLLCALLLPVYAILLLVLADQQPTISLGSMAALGAGQVLLTVLILSISGSIRWRRVARLLQSREKVDYQALLTRAQDLIGLGDARDVAARLVEILSETTSTSRIQVYLRDQQRQGFVLLATWPVTNEPRAEYEIDDPILGWLCELEGALLLQDLHEQASGAHGQEVAEFLSSQGIDVAIPVHTPSSGEALILLGPPRQRGIYEPTDLRLFELLGRTTASAFQMASSFEREQVSREIERISRTVSGLAHEFRNSMLPARTFLELIPQRRDDDDFVGNFSQVALGQLRRSFSIIEQLKQLHHERALELAENDLPALLTLVVSSVEPHAEGHSVSIEVECEPSSMMVSLDRDQLTQALMNLLLNAVQHAASAPVHVRLYRESAGRGDGPARVVITIHNAEEIPAEIAPNLFVPFFTTGGRDGMSGAGLGLTIAQKIVHAHGGSLSFHSAPGKGTTFVLVLPSGLTRTFGNPAEELSKPAGEGGALAAIDLAPGLEH